MSAAIDAALRWAPTPKADEGALSDSVFLGLSVKYVARFIFRDFLAQSVTKKDLASVLQNRGITQMAKNECLVLARKRQNSATAVRLMQFKKTKTGNVTMVMCLIYLYHCHPWRSVHCFLATLPLTNETSCLYTYQPLSARIAAIFVRGRALYFAISGRP